MAASSVAHGQGRTVIKTDSSWGRAAGEVARTGGPTVLLGNSSRALTVRGDVYTITQQQGRTAGLNLFHSFESFSIGPGDAVVFTTNSANLQNVISRVSGSSPTRIDGILTLKPAGDSKPAFFFINPAGVTFGANALVDMPAAFHVSSARQLNFANGVVFKAGNGADSTLSIAPPTSFGFLGSEADVKLQGMGSNQSPFLDMDQSTVASLFDVTARSIDFDGSALGMRLPSNSTASSPSVRLAATGSHLVDLPLQGLPNAPSTGSITLASSQIRVDDEDAAVSRNNVQTTRPMIILSGGPIAISDTFIHSVVSNPGTVEGAGIDIRAGQLTIARSTIRTLASAYTSAVGGAINIAARGDIEITGIPRQGGIFTEGFGFGAAGDITIQAQNLSLGTDVRSSGLNGGVAGSIHIRVGDKLILRDAAKIDVSSFADGSDIEIYAADMRIAGGGIYNRTLSSGRAGNITITADNSITVDYPGIFIVSNG